MKEEIYNNLNKECIYLWGTVAIRMIRFVLLYFLTWVFNSYLGIFFFLSKSTSEFFAPGSFRHDIYFSFFYILVEIIVVILIIYNIRKFLFKNIYNGLEEKFKFFISVEKIFFVVYFICIWLVTAGLLLFFLIKKL